MARVTIHNLIETGEDLYKKLPDLPKNVRDFFVTVTPWVVLVVGILRVIRNGRGVVLLFTIPFGFLTALFILGAILGLISGIMLLVAFAHVHKERKEGWVMVFWSEVVALLSALVLPDPIINVIGVLIVFYILYQIKPFYR